MEYDGSTGQILRRYVYGNGIDEALNQVDISDSSGSRPRATFIPDIQGSTIAALDSTSGTLTQTGYKSFGETSTTTGSFRYTRRRIDAETGGLYYYRARMYASSWGRFAQADTIGYHGGNNLYAYVGNDPLNSIDPFGLDTQVLRGIGGNIGATLGISGSVSVGVNVPDNPFNIGGYGFVANATYSTFKPATDTGLGGEVGAFIGVGVQGNISHSNGAVVTGLSVDKGQVVEVNAGYGLSGGGSVQGQNLPNCVTCVSSGSIGGGRIGFGAGFDVGFGDYKSYTYTQTINSAVKAVVAGSNYVTSQVRSLFGRGPAISSSGK